MTKVEAAYRGLLAVLTAKAGEADTALPPPERNAALIKAFKNGGGVINAGVWLNQVDDDPDIIGEEAGGVAERQTEFWQNVRLEWLVERKDDLERETVFDTGLEEIAAALTADRTLGGLVDDIEILGPVRRDITLSGTPRIKACYVPVRLLLTAPTAIG
ncbi:hypothetical protein [Hyphobacterium sp.]|uniref:hypothetical protein n=1 Tax=Hyphobacterium sp. TaxID=2004662 RepID=UPI003BAB3DA9